MELCAAGGSCRSSRLPQDLEQAGAVHKRCLLNSAVRRVYPNAVQEAALPLRVTPAGCAAAASEVSGEVADGHRLGVRTHKHRPAGTSQLLLQDGNELPSSRSAANGICSISARWQAMRCATSTVAIVMLAPCKTVVRFLDSRAIAASVLRVCSCLLLFQFGHLQVLNRSLQRRPGK